MIYYSVYDRDGNKFADCGSEKDAKWLAEVRNGTYKSNRLDWGRTIDMATIDDQYAHHFGELKELPTIEVNGQTLQLQQNLQQPLDL